MRRVITVVLSAIFILSCNKNIEKAECLISVDIPNIQLNEIGDLFVADTINLETSLPSLIGVISRVLFIEDNILIGDFINNKLLLFSKEGDFITNIGEKGQGPGEYISIHDFFVISDTINIYDFYQRKILQYSLDGKYIAQKVINSISFDRIIPLLHETEYITLNTYTNQKENPKFGWLDNKFNSFHSSNEQRENGNSLPNTFFNYDDLILYWEMMNNTIYSISNDTVASRYKIDFLDYSIPNDMDINKKIEYYAQNSSTTAGFVNNVIETDSLLTFTFIHNLCTYWTIYNKNNKKCNFFKLAHNGEMDKLQYISTIYKNSFIGVYMFDNAKVDSNPAIVKLKFK